MSFCRVSSDQRKEFTAGERSVTYLKSLQYGLGALEEIEKYKREENRRNTQFDPFQEFKRDPDWNLKGEG